MDSAPHQAAVDAAAQDQQQEINLLRDLYEQVRRVLRFNGVDKQRTLAAADAMDACVEKVKQFDGGTMDAEDLPLKFPMAESTLFDQWKDSPAVKLMSFEQYREIVRATEQYHGIVTPNTDKPSNDYVGHGMFKGETLALAALGWARRCNERGQEELTGFLKRCYHEFRLSEGEELYWTCYAICDAYESGIGHGLQRDGLDNADGSLYGGSRSQQCNLAYQIGYEEGVRRKVAEKQPTSK